jgi:hypothetical protein
MAIRNFIDKEAAKLFVGRFSRKLPQHIQRRAMWTTTRPGETETPEAFEVAKI